MFFEFRDGTNSLEIAMDEAATRYLNTNSEKNNP